MRFAHRVSVELVGALGGGTSLLGAIQWYGDAGALAALATLLGALTVAVSLIFRSLFQQLAESRADRAQLRDELRKSDAEWRQREDEWRREREQFEAEIDQLRDEVGALRAVIRKAGLDS